MNEEESQRYIGLRWVRKVGVKFTRKEVLQKRLGFCEDGLGLH